MIAASQLAGFFTAHAVWSVSDGDSFTPMLAYTTVDNKRTLHRLVVNDDPAAAVAHGKEKLDSNDIHAKDAALLYDGRISLGAEKVDAIIVEMRAYLSPESEAIIAVPYTPTASGQFRVHKPKLLVWKNCDDFDMDAALQSFFDGVDGHEKGRRIWNECLDESK